MNITQDQFDSIMATMGWVVLATQIPSGWLADKLSSRRMLIVSVIMTGTGTLIWGLTMQGVFPTHMSLGLLYAIFITFDVSTTLFLWSPLWKVLSQQGTKEQQGSMNGLLGLVIITLIGTIATSMASQGNNNVFYLLVYVISGTLSFSFWNLEIHPWYKPKINCAWKN